MSLTELSDQDIKQYYKSNKLFGGVFTNYNIPKQIKEAFYILLMLPNKSSTNGHWLLAFNIGTKCIFVDSFGCPPCVAFKNFMKSSGKPCYYSNIDFQALRSEDCGEYCCHIANELLRGKTMRQITNEFSKDTKRNDKILANYAKTEHITPLRGDGQSGAGIIDNIKQFFKGNRLRFDASGRDILKKYGDKYIAQIQIVRRPLNHAIQKLGNILTRGDLKRTERKLNYKDLFHLYAILYFYDSPPIQIEKQNTPKLSMKIQKPDGDQLNFEARHKITLNELIFNAIKLVGENDFYRYDVRNANCQLWLKWLLDGSGINDPIYDKFIMQNAPELLKKLPSFVQYGLDKLLNFSTRADSLINGGQIILA